MKEKRKVTTFEAFLPMICMALMVIVGNIIFGIRIEFILLLASLIAGLVSVRAGYTWDELIEARWKHASAGDERNYPGMSATKNRYRTFRYGYNSSLAGTNKTGPAYPCHDRVRRHYLVVQQ